MKGKLKNVTREILTVCFVISMLIPANSAAAVSKDATVTESTTNSVSVSNALSSTIESNVPAATIPNGESAMTIGTTNFDKVSNDLYVTNLKGSVSNDTIMTIGSDNSSVVSNNTIGTIGSDNSSVVSNNLDVTTGLTRTNTTEMPPPITFTDSLSFYNSSTDGLEMAEFPTAYLPMAMLLSMDGKTNVGALKQSVYWMSNDVSPKLYATDYCKCEQDVCTCCTFQVIQKRHYDGCVKVTLLREDFGFSMSLIFNDNTIFKTEISGRNPPPICAPLAGPFVEICVKFSDIYLNGKDVHMCIGLEGLIFKWQAFYVNFKCFNLKVIKKG